MRIYERVVNKMTYVVRDVKWKRRPSRVVRRYKDEEFRQGSASFQESFHICESRSSFETFEEANLLFGL